MDSSASDGVLNVSAASLEALYRRLFSDDGGAAEHPSYEAKRFYLTPDMIDLHRDNLVETIAGIANVGRETGLIFCQGRGDPSAIEDPERLDQIARAAVHPRVHFTIQRMEVAGRMVDLIAIPLSLTRPHVMRASGGANRYFIPLRGAANNITTARHELDLMYREATLDMLRRAFPHASIEIDAGDAVLRYVEEIGYGLSPE
jgi:hypothetical protein